MAGLPAPLLNDRDVDRRAVLGGVALAALIALTLMLVERGPGDASNSGGRVDVASTEIAEYYAGVALLSNNRRLPSGQARRDIAVLLMRGLQDGEFTDHDRDVLAKTVSFQTSLNRQESRMRVDRVISDLGRTWRDAISEPTTPMVRAQ